MFPFSKDSNNPQKQKYISNEVSNQNDLYNNKIEFHPTITQTIIPKLSLSDFLRTSSESIPDNEYLIKNTGIPFGINIVPFPNIEQSLITQYSFGGGNGKIPRCFNCQAFINLFSKLNNSSWKCNICSKINQLKNIDEITVKKIIDNNNDVYEIFANSDYIEKSPMSSNYVFILDVTNKSIANESLKIFIETIRYIVNNKYFINEERTFLSFITFSYNSVCFYKLNKKLNSMQILEITGDEPFIPDNPKNLIFSLEDNLNFINIILDSIDNIYNINNIQGKENKETDQLIFAIECGKALLQNKGGKLIILNSSISWKNKLINKEINDKKEENDIFIMLGKLLTKYQITCDIFEIHGKNENHGVGDLIKLCNYCNGNFLFYKNFNSSMHYNNLFNQLIKSISNQRAYEIIIQYYITPQINLNQNLSVIPIQINNSFLLPCIDVNQSYSFILNYKDNKSKENQESNNQTNSIKNKKDIYKEENLNEIYIQFSIIYTSLEGIRIIRVINKRINICNDKLEFFRNIDIECTCTIMTKFLIKLLNQSNNIFNAMAEYKYKYFIYALSLLKQMNLEELISSFLICYLGIMKNKFFCLEPLKYKMNLDDILTGRNHLLKMKIDDLMNIIVPKIYDITNILKNIETFDNVFYQPETLSKESIKKDKIYIIDNGIFLNFHFTDGENNGKRIKIFFGEDMNFDNVGTYYHSEQSVFEDNKNCDNLEVEKCKEIANLIRNNKKNYYQDIFFSFENSPSEAIVKQCLLIGNFCSWYQFSYKDAFNKI